MAPQTRSRPAGRPSARTVRHAPRAAGSSPAGFGPPRPPAAAASPRAGGRTQQGSQSQRPAPARQQTPAPAPGSSSRRRPVRYERPERIRQARAPSGNYQPVILAEFVGVILVIALSPVAKGESSQGVSPYGGGDMVKLTAATLLYVVLGFISSASQGAARIAAWFGGLTLIAVGLAEGTAVAKEIGLFTGGLSAAAQGQPSPGSPLSQGAAQAANLQQLGEQEAISQGQGPGSQLGQAVVNALAPVFSRIGPQGVPVSLTGQGKPL